MALTGEDKNWIKENVVTSITKEMDKRFLQQNEFFSNALRDAVEEIHQAHPTREEFEEVKNKVELLEEELERLKGKIR